MKKGYLTLLILWMFNCHAMEHVQFCMIDQEQHTSYSPLLATLSASLQSTAAQFVSNMMNANAEAEDSWPQEAHSQLSSATTDLPDFFSMLEEITPQPAATGNCESQEHAASFVTLKPVQIISHEQRQPVWACKECKIRFDNYAYSSWHNLLMHGKNYTCRYCGYGAMAISTIERHIIGVHLKLRPYTCSYCRKAFSYGRSRNTHEKTCKRKK